jgi:hypothetical protein
MASIRKINNLNEVKLQKLKFQTNSAFVRVEVFASVTMKNAVFWHVTVYGSCKTDASGEHMASIIRVKK